MICKFLSKILNYVIWSVNCWRGPGPVAGPNQVRPVRVRFESGSDWTRSVRAVRLNELSFIAPWSANLPSSPAPLLCRQRSPFVCRHRPSPVSGFMSVFTGRLPHIRWVPIDRLNGRNLEKPLRFLFPSNLVDLWFRVRFRRRLPHLWRLPVDRCVLLTGEILRNPFGFFPVVIFCPYVSGSVSVSSGPDSAASLISDDFQ